MLIFLRRTWRSSRSEMAAMSSPSISTWPRVGSISRLKRRTRVDLPEPERPITTKISPSLMARLTSWTPRVCPVFCRMLARSCPFASNLNAFSG